MKIDGYVRVSRVGGREGDSFQSPKMQQDAIAHYAQVHGIEIAAWWTDLDESGAKTSRPAFDQMMARVESRKTGGVIVAKIDRFGRSLIGALDGISRIDAVGGEFISTADQFDTTNPNGRLVLNMMLSVAQFELERITATWKESRGRANQRGIHQSKAPFGYTRGDDKRLVPDENAESVRSIFKRRGGGTPGRT